MWIKITALSEIKYTYDCHNNSNKKIALLFTVSKKHFFCLKKTLFSSIWYFFENIWLAMHHFEIITAKRTFVCANWVKRISFTYETWNKLAKILFVTVQTPILGSAAYCFLLSYILSYTQCLSTVKFHYVKSVSIRSYSGPHFFSSISPYSVQMREDEDQNNSEYRHFSRSVLVSDISWIMGIPDMFCCSNKMSIMIKNIRIDPWSSDRTANSMT